MNDNQKTMLKALIYERLNLVYKTHLLHEGKMVEEKKLDLGINLTRKQKRYAERKIEQNILDIERNISRVEKQNTDLFKELTDKKVIDFIENCTDLYSDFTDLFVKAYFESQDKVELKASILKKVNNEYKIFE